MITPLLHEIESTAFGNALSKCCVQLNQTLPSFDVYKCVCSMDPLGPMVSFDDLFSNRKPMSDSDGLWTSLQDVGMCFVPQAVKKKT